MKYFLTLFITVLLAITASGAANVGIGSQPVLAALTNGQYFVLTTGNASNSPVRLVQATTVSNQWAAGAAVASADQNSFVLSDRILHTKRIHPSSEGYEFWDDFNRTVTNSPGVSPSGHPWGFSSASGVNSNVVFVQDGAFKIATNAQAGATYWGITNTNPNTVWNKFKGSFLYREYDANGFRQNVGFILANNYFRGGTNWLHVGINQNGFQVQRQLTTFFIDELYPTELETDIEHTYEIILSDDKLWARVAGNYYFVQDDALTNYTSFPVVIYEHNMKMTNQPAQYFGEWLSAAAGQFESPIVNMAKPFSFTSNSTALSSITFSDGSVQTTAGGSGSGTNFNVISANWMNASNGIAVGSAGTRGSIDLPATNGNSAVFGVAISNSVPVTNLFGLLHKAYASVVVLDCNDGSNFRFTNRAAAANTTLVLTNLAQGQEVSISMLGEVSGGTSRTVTIVPHLGYLVADMDAFGIALALNKTVTLTNGNGLEISALAKWEIGTNFCDIVTRQYQR